MAEPSDTPKPQVVAPPDSGFELILPEQYFADRSGDPRSEPARRLMLAVLEDAVLTLGSHCRSPSPHSRRIVAEVELWFASNSRVDPFAFASICDVLGLDPAYLRNTIRAWKQRLTTLTKYRHPHAGRRRARVATLRR